MTYSLAGLLVVLSVSLGGVAMMTCGSKPAPQASPSSVPANDDAMTDLPAARDVKARHDNTLMAIPGVVGTGIAETATGEPVIEVYVEHLTDDLAQAVPDEIEAVRVRVVETGPFIAR